MGFFVIGLKQGISKKRTAARASKPATYAGFIYLHFSSG
ncbi:hypothetical protein O59_003581 [Cellvibrio sp. BR]|nr:hypothetical protein O59_003581 [Cellvibrio sp. BR]